MGPKVTVTYTKLSAEGRFKMQLGLQKTRTTPTRRKITTRKKERK